MLTSDCDTCPHWQKLNVPFHEEPLGLCQHPNYKYKDHARYKLMSKINCELKNKKNEN